MENNKHTPGPWEIKTIQTKDGDYPGIYASAAKHPYYFIASCGWITNKTDANARLIAAAPELLEALKDLLSAAKSNNDFESDSLLQDAAETAEYIIQKAEGGQ